MHEQQISLECQKRGTKNTNQSGSIKHYDSITDDILWHGHIIPHQNLAMLYQTTLTLHVLLSSSVLHSIKVRY